MCTVSSSNNSYEKQQRQRTLFFWCCINHSLWSTQTVASRYLQVYAKPLLFDGQGILASTKFTAGILVFIYSHYCNTTSTLQLPTPTITTTTTNIIQSLKTSSRTDDTDTTVDDDDDDDTTSSITKYEKIDEIHATKDEEPTNTVSTRKKYLYALAFGTVATCRAALNIASTKYTLSYYITTINSLTPLVVSIGDSILLKADLPWIIWPCTLSSFFGCTIIGISQSPFFKDSTTTNTSSFTSNDIIGCTLQIFSMFFSSGARLLMKRTENILSRNEAVQTNNICNTLFPLLYTLIINPHGWYAFRYLFNTWKNLIAWLSISILVYTIASTNQMSLVRSMGPGMYSSLGALRVFLSAILSAIWLNEPVDNWLEWVGLAIIMITVTIFTVLSVGDIPSSAYYYCSRNKQQRYDPVSIEDQYDNSNSSDDDRDNYPDHDGNAIKERDDENINSMTIVNASIKAEDYSELQMKVINIDSSPSLAPHN